MSFGSPLFERDDCVSCPASPPPCSCSQSESCVTISRSCTACPTTRCIPLLTTQSTPKKSSFSTGALAGSIIGFLVAILILVVGIIVYRRQILPRRKLAALEKGSAVRDVPAPAEAVLSRPDPTEKRQSTLPPLPTSPLPPTIVSGRPETETAYGSSLLEPENPFSDHASIQTAANSTSTNAIPIALVQPPQRPERSPDLDLRLDNAEPRPSLSLSHTNVSMDDNHLRTPRPHYAESTRSDVSQSTVSTAMSMDLNEVPTIVTPLHGVRQVVGVAKAEVVSAPTTPSARTPRASRPAITGRSPLAQNSFTRADLVQQQQQQQETDPFADSASLVPIPPSRPESTTSSVISSSTFGPSSRSHGYRDDSRPSSVNSGTGTIIADIGSATRVVVGMQTPAAQSSYPPSTTIRRITPTASSASSVRSDNRMSDLSLSSSRADSILESFPFVPPSPISATPPRTPQAPGFSPPSPVAATTPIHEVTPPPPVNRHLQGLSTFSTASSGLGAFPFQFEGHPLPNQDPRSTLDTIALSRDVQRFPLEFDGHERDSFMKPA